MLPPQRHFKKLVLASAVLSVLNVYAAESTTETEEDQKAERIEVTGSRIKRTDIESASPVTVISFDQIQKEGHQNVAEVLQSFAQSVGGVQGEQFTNSFTPNAMMINLRGFGPGYTLVLINGKRMAEYPLPYNGQSNFVNLASIPTGIVERIEVLSGGASSVYGSDAVAGVVNIITRKDLEGVTAYLKMGTTSDGGGDSQRLQVVGGKNFDAVNFTFAYEYFNTDPIYGKDRSYTDSRQDDPTLTGPADLDRDLLIINRGDPTGSYIDMTPETCAKFTDTTYTTRTVGAFAGGKYCGRDGAGDETLRGQRDWHTLYGALSTPVGDNGEFKASAILWKSSSKHDSFRLWWGSDDPFLEYDPAIDDFTDFRYMQRVFQPSETGEQSTQFDEQSTIVNLEYSASFGDYDFNVAFSTSRNKSDNSLIRFKKEAIDSYFLNRRGDFEELYCGAIDGCGFQINEINYDHFLNPLTPSIAASLMGESTTEADSKATTLNAGISGDLFRLPAGAVQFAAIVEAGKQDYEIMLDDRLAPGGLDWFGITGTGGGGERERVAAGAEFIIPVTETLKLIPSARYDKYNDDTAVDDAVTYGFGVEYRPFDGLLLRTNYQTSFRAPDMHYVYADESGFYTSVVDFVQCWADPSLGEGTTAADCADADYTASVFGTRSGDLALKEEEGNSLTAGLVWEVFENFNFTLDYYDVDLKDAVSDEDLTDLMRKEAMCETDFDNYATDNPGECARVTGLITRHADDGTVLANDVEEVAVKPINTGRFRQRGIDAEISYRVETAGWGTFKTSLQASHVLETWRQLTKESEIEKDFRDDLFNNGDRRSNVRGTLAWQGESWDATLLGQRRGGTSNYNSDGRVGPWITYNASVGYSFTKDDRIGLTAINLTNRRAQEDAGWKAWPYYNRAHYNAFGREVFVEYSHSF